MSERDDIEQRIADKEQHHEDERGPKARDGTEEQHTEPYEQEQGCHDD